MTVRAVGCLPDRQVRRRRSGIAVCVVPGVFGIHADWLLTEPCGVPQPRRQGGEDEEPGHGDGRLVHQGDGGDRPVAGGGVRARVESGQPFQGAGCADGEGVRVGDGKMMYRSGLCVW